MGKVSVGLRGWRFDEDDIFGDDEQFKPLEEIPADPRQRLLRLLRLVDKPCDACYLLYGEEEKHRCNPASVVYGEPLDEVLVCDAHETAFIYWYQHAGGSDLRGQPHFADQFHEWFENGNRAPEDFERVEHVDTDPESLPDLPDSADIQAQLEVDYQPRTIDLAEYVSGPAGSADERTDDERIDDEELADLDLETGYPTADE